MRHLPTAPPFCARFLTLPTTQRLGQAAVQHAREAEDACRRLDDTLLMQIGSLMGGGADEDTASQLEKLQADRDPYAAGAAADLGKSLLEFDEANEKRQQNIVNDLDEKIARATPVKNCQERAARRQKLAGLIEEEKRAAEVERQINAMLAELQTRSDALKKTIADTEATRAALGQSDAEQLKIEHRIELAEGLTATCATLLQDLDKAKAAKADAEEKAACLRRSPGRFGRVGDRPHRHAAPAERQPRGPAGPRAGGRPAPARCAVQCITRTPPPCPRTT